MSQTVPLAAPVPSSAIAAQRPSVLALLVMLSGTFMVVIDFFIVNVAIPSIQHDLHASAGALQLIVIGYGLANAAALITGGRLGDIHGRRRLFVIGVGLFTLASAACGMAPNAAVLVAARCWVCSTPERNARRRLPPMAWPWGWPRQVVRSSAGC